MISPRILFEGNPTEAYKYVGMAKDFGRSTFAAGIISKVWRLGNEVQIRVLNNIASRICKVWITAGGETPFLAMAWIPEGLLLTPHTDVAEYGYGFPKRDKITGERINAPFGTLIAAEEDEAVNQVLLNRFENNKYLDRKGFITGLPAEQQSLLDKKLPDENPRLRTRVGGSVDQSEVIVNPLRVVYWPPFYTPASFGNTFWTLEENRLKWIDEPGLNKGKKFKPFLPPTRDEDGNIVDPLPLRQFDESRVSLIYEVESTDWFCHWPEELLYENDAFEAIFQQTNVYRADVGRKPVVREIRGHANLSRMVLSEVDRAKKQYHNNERDYREGYQLVVDRAYNGGVNLISGGENLVMVGGVYGTSWTIGLIVANSWFNSPYHYANMINSDWDTPLGGTALDVVGNIGTSITESGVNPLIGSITTWDPPLSGTEWSQFFIKRRQWLYAGTCEHSNQYGTVSTFSFVGSVGGPYWQSGLAEFLAYQGRFILITPIYEIAQLAIRTYNVGSYLFIKDGILCFRVIYFYIIEAGDQRELRAIYRPVHGNHADWVEDASLTLDAIYGVPKTCVTTSLDGEKSLFAIEKTMIDIKATFFITDIKELDFCPKGSRTVYFEERDGFSLGADIVGPLVTYTVTDLGVSVLGLGDLFDYRQEGVGEFDYCRYYNSEGELVSLKYSIDLLINQEWDLADYLTLGLKYTNVEFRDEEFITFNSGKKLTLRNFGFSGEGRNSPPYYAALTEGSYFCFLFYLNLVTEDVVYGKLEVTSSFDEYYGEDIISLTMKIYVSYDDQEVLIREYAPVAVNRTVLAYPAQAISDKEDGNGSLGREFYNSFYLGASFINKGSSQLSVFPWKDDSDGWYCGPVGVGPVGYPGKLIIGEYPVSLESQFAQTQFCSIYYDNLTTFGHRVTLPHINASIEPGYCYYARYKDRIVLQLQVRNLFRIIPDLDEQTTIYANFLLDTEVGIGTLTNILPLGAINV